MAAVLSPSVVRAIRIAAAAALLSIGGLFVLLWVRNFWRADVAWAPLPGGGHALFASQDGQTEVSLSLPSSGAGAATSPRNASPGWGAQSYMATPKSVWQILLAHSKPFRYRRMWQGRELNMIAPYWFLVPVTCMLAATPWIRWSKRFSLRALLISTTVIAIVLAIWQTSKW
jgi:hypothetical protein